MAAPFRMLVVAVDEFVELPALPSSATAERFFELLAPYGAERLSAPAPQTGPAVGTFLAAWASAQDGPACTLVYWVGHGEADGDVQWLLGTDSRRPHQAPASLPATQLAEYVRTRWIQRVAGDPEAWTVVVLDCCNADVASANMLNLWTSRPDRQPRRLALLRVANGASTVGHFVQAFQEALGALSDQDTSIRLRSLLTEVADRLSVGVDVDATNWLTRDAVLVDETITRATTAMTLDLVDEWRRVVAELPDEERSHFLEKAQSHELGELAWHFSGRHEESRRLASFLREEGGGLLVVTGEPGAGKSALLGQAVVLATPALNDVLGRAGLLPHVPPEERPPVGAFDAVVQCTGKTLPEVVAGLDVAGPAPDAPALIERLRATPSQVVVLVDALDEAQEPEAIAQDLLRPMGRLPNVKVVVGTRRSLSEGPDQPEPARHELLEALGVTVGQTLFLEREPGAMQEYARRKLVGHPEAERVVEGLAAVDQPFLFVRMLTNEIRARAASGHPLDLDRMLAGDHQQLFGLAMERLAAQSPAAVTLVRALAYSQGRGVPRVDRTWATIAAAVDPPARFSEQDVDEALRLAASYITLDGEGGQSVYRLAHKTFAEYWHTRDGDLAAIHASIAAALHTGALESGGWDVANPYVLSHLLEHAASDGVRTEALCTDPAFLAAVLSGFGADGLVDRLVAARRVAHSRAVEAVTGAVRRARVPLARDPDQLAGQLYARLYHHDDRAVLRLVDAVGGIAPAHWMRALTPGLSWTADIEVIQDFPGKVRALAFGKVEGTTVLAVGYGTTLAVWDPRSGVIGRTIDNAPERILSVGLGTLGGRDVAVMGSYEGPIAVRDLATGDALLRLNVGGNVYAVCMGVVDGRDVIVHHDSQVVRWWDARTGEPLGAQGVTDQERVVALASTSHGVLIASMREGQARVTPLGAAEGEPWSIGIGVPTAASVAEVDGRILVAGAGGGGSGVLSCWEWLGRVADYVGMRALLFPVRTVAVGSLDDTIVVAAGSLDEDEAEFGYVAVRTVWELDEGAVEWLASPVALARWDVGLVALCLDFGGQVSVRTVPENEMVSVPADPGEAALIVAGPEHAALRFTDGRSMREGMPAAESTWFRRADPGSWPTTAEAYGVFNGRAVVATGSYAGVVWVTDLDSGTVLAGPLVSVPRKIDARLALSKPGLPAVRALSMATAGSQTVLATVCDGRIRLFDLTGGGELELPAMDRSSAVAVGFAADRGILVRGSDRGQISAYFFGEERPVASLTLDTSVDELWLVRGEMTVAAMTTGRQLHLFDFSG